MRLVQVTIPAGKRETVLGMLDDEGIDYVVTDETSGREYTGVIYFPLPDNAVEPILDELEELGIEDQSYTVVVDAQTVVSRQFEDLKERYSTDDADEERISRQELHTEAENMTPTFPVYVTMTLISAIVATAGLLLDSPAVVVGSMVIAPLIGPALAASVGTVTDDDEMFWNGIKYQTFGLGLAIVGAAVFAWLLKTANIVPPGIELSSIGEISERFTPDLLLLVVALGAGVAGVLALSTGISVALVGVMIAAALIPPAAAAGIAIAWGLVMETVGATVLVLVNAVSVNLAGVATLWYTGYRPQNWFETDDAHRKMLRNVAVFAVIVLVLSGFLGSVTLSTYQTSSFQQEINNDIQDTIDQAEYERFTLLDVQSSTGEDVTYEQGTIVGINQQITQVTVTVGYENDPEQAELADTLYERINEDVDQEVAVEVRFIEVEHRQAQ
ncbi:TIGR00341 family protein [Halalkalicoccus subterraneus]|uniref:TIGR00341 family protein n=1 Tax=Halalkalicoccus subterraneus TaxID=2675002 RepID=UPI000EFD199B|nr:TIGR00341 family protein [Halalkalicoccus subterraneus]